MLTRVDSLREQDGRPQRTRPRPVEPRVAAQGERADASSPSAPAAVLALQRGAGNQAVARLLEVAVAVTPPRSAGATPPRSAVAPATAVAAPAGAAAAPDAPAPRQRSNTLARFAVDVATRADGASGATLVGAVNVGDRPPGVFGGDDKSHTVGWITWIDGLRMDIMHQPLPEAIRRVELLYQLTLQMPSAGRSANFAKVPVGRRGAPGKRVHGPDDAADLRGVEPPSKRAKPTPGERADRKSGAGTPDARAGEPERKRRRKEAPDAAADAAPLATDAAATADTEPAVDPTKAQERHTAAADRARLASAAAAAALIAGSADLQLAALQELIAGYLQLRNTLPLSAVVLPNPEPGSERDYVRGYEFHATARENRNDAADADDRIDFEVEEPVAELRAGLWSQLDQRALALLATMDDPAAAPGIDPDGDQQERLQRVADVVRDHLTTMRASYPKAFAAATLDSDASVKDFLDGIHLEPTVAQRGRERYAFDAAWADLILAKVKHDGALPSLGARGKRVAYHPGGASDDERFGVQLKLGADGRIASLAIGGRSRGVLGSEEGSHLTAWTALVDAVRTTVLGKTPDAAMIALIALGLEFRDPPRAAGEHFRGAAEESLTRAREAFQSAVALAEAGGGAFEATQALARAVLMLLNAQPLAAMKKGLANGSGESHTRKRVTANAANAALPTDRATAVGYLWRLLDLEALDQLAEPVPAGTLTPLAALRVGAAPAPTEPGTKPKRVIKPDETELDTAVADMPGSIPGEHGAGRVAAVIERHRRLMEVAYPDIYALAQLGDPDALLVPIVQSSTIDPWSFPDLGTALGIGDVGKAYADAGALAEQIAGLMPRSDKLKSTSGETINDEAFVGEADDVPLPVRARSSRSRSTPKPFRPDDYDKEKKPGRGRLPTSTTK